MKFVAYERTKQGTGASRRLRNAAKVPGIVYGAGAPAMIELDHNALFFALKKEAFHSSILEMELAGKTETVLLRDYSMHAFKPIVMHVDFQRVDEKTTLRKRVPLHFVNEEVSEAVKTDKCFINKAISELEIECLAQKLPEFITIDLGGMKKGDSIHAGDLKLDEGLGGRVDRAEDVGHVCKRDQLRAASQEGAINVEVEQAILGHGDEFQLDAAFRLKHVPGDQVRVVFHLGQDDEVARLEVGARPRVSYEIDRLGGIARVDDLTRRSGVDELCDLLARAFIHGRGFLGQSVNTAMDVGVRAAIEVVHGLDDGQRLLAGGRGIEIDHAHTRLGFTLEDGKVFADLFDVEGHK